MAAVAVAMVATFLASFPRKRESKASDGRLLQWTPAFAGVTI
jgi:hypothetical protein